MEGIEHPHQHPQVGRADGSGAMFDRIARRYDLLNRINSLGLDRSWRRRTIERIDLGASDRLLDLATGTADLIVEAHEAVPGICAVGLDPSAQMLVRAREKLARIGNAGTELVQGDARALPFAEGSFDAVTMAFGIRNVPDRKVALAEIHRVLTPGGRVAILELSEPRVGLMSSAARLYIRTVVPWMGRLFSGADAYRYLRLSIEAFPTPEEFMEELRASGFVEVSYTSFTFGACVLFYGKKGEAR